MILVLTLGACSSDREIAGDPVVSQKPSVFVLTWPDYDGDPEKLASATWVLNGESLGQGDVGYKHLIEQMKTFPVGSTLKLQFTPPDATGGGEGYYVPLRGSEYDNVAKSRNIKEESPPFGPWH
jgi:hypothetical protein